MATRIFKGPARYAEAASTDTSSPSTGTGYRDVSITNAQIQAGLKKFDTLAGSAIENEYLFRLSTLVDLIERTGTLGWNAETNYITNARVIADNGIEYRALSASLNADPMTSPALWQEVRSQLAVGETLFLTVDLTPNQLGYVGTWVSVESGASLGAVDPGDPAIGTVTGTNNVNTPLLAHTHTKGTMEIEGRVNTDRAQIESANGAFDGPIINAAAGVNGSGITIGRHFDFKASRNWTGETSSEGTPGSTIDVSGRVLNGVWWKRTA